MRQIEISLGLLLAIGLLMCGCADKEPYKRTDVWYPTGANAGNIAAMAVNPDDLIHGRGDHTINATQTTAAIDRVRLDHPKALLGGSSGSGSGNSGPASGATN